MKLICCFSIVVLSEMTLASELSSRALNGRIEHVRSACNLKNQNNGKWKHKVSIGGAVVPDENDGSKNITGTTKNWSELIWYRMKRVFSEPTETACSIIPEPFVIPDISISSPIHMKATNGTIPGFRQFCKIHTFIPKVTWQGRDAFIRHELNLSGLNIQYHVVAKDLNVNRSFNFTLVPSSRAKMNLLFQKAQPRTYPCPLTIEHMDLKLNFDDQKCRRECHAVMLKLRCHLYHTVSQAISLLLEPYQLVIKRTLCPDPNGNAPTFKPDLPFLF